jgi:hypothetical protein
MQSDNILLIYNKIDYPVQESTWIFINWHEYDKKGEVISYLNPYYEGLTSKLTNYNFSLAGTLMSSGLTDSNYGYALFAYDYAADNNHWFIAGYLNGNNEISEDDSEVVDTTITTSESDNDSAQNQDGE